MIQWLAAAVNNMARRPYDAVTENEPTQAERGTKVCKKLAERACSEPMSPLHAAASAERQIQVHSLLSAERIA